MWLCVGGRRHGRATWRLAVLGFACFCGYSLGNVLVGVSSCGCFGVFSVNPGYMFFADLTAIGALLVCRPKAPGESDRVEIRPRRAYLRPLVAVSPAIAFTLLLCSAYWSRPPAPSRLDVDAWRGKRLPLLDDVDIGQELERGRWLVVLSRSGCRRCATAAEAYPELAGSLESAESPMRLAVVDLSPSVNTAAPEPAEATDYLRGRFLGRTRWAGGLPMGVELDDGVVLRRVDVGPKREFDEPGPQARPGDRSVAKAVKPGNP